MSSQSSFLMASTGSVLVHHFYLEVMAMCTILASLASLAVIAEGKYSPSPFLTRLQVHSGTRLAQFLTAVAALK